MAYIYRHIRLDTNQPFYIGIGSDKSFKRANEKSRRNKIWNDIVSKSDYEVEILFDDITWEKACEKEIEFISLYGKKNNNTGILANMTDGGEGTLGRCYRPTEETRLKQSLAKRGRKMSEEAKRHLAEFHKDRIFSEKHKAALKEAAKKRDYKQFGNKVADKIAKTLGSKPFIVVDSNNNIIGEFINKKRCARETGISLTMLHEMCSGKRQSCKGMKIIMK